MNINDIIKRPILTEKSYANIENNVYTFEVDRRATKIQIKQTLEHIFKVEVAKVNVINSKPKTKRVGKFVGKTRNIKRAIVTLKAGSTINLFPEETTK